MSRAGSRRHQSATNVPPGEVCGQRPPSSAAHRRPNPIACSRSVGILDYRRRPSPSRLAGISDDELCGSADRADPFRARSRLIAQVAGQRRSSRRARWSHEAARRGERAGASTDIAGGRPAFGGRHQRVGDARFTHLLGLSPCRCGRGRADETQCSGDSPCPSCDPRVLRENPPRMITRSTPAGSAISGRSASPLVLDARQIAPTTARDETDLAH